MNTTTKIIVLRGIIENPDKTKTHTVKGFGKTSEVVNKLVVMVWEKDEITYYARLAGDKVIEVLKDEVTFLPRSSTIVTTTKDTKGNDQKISYSETLEVKYEIDSDIVNMWVKQLILN